MSVILLVLSINYCINYYIVKSGSPNLVLVTTECRRVVKSDYCRDVDMVWMSTWRQDIVTEVFVQFRQLLQKVRCHLDVPIVGESLESQPPVALGAYLVLYRDSCTVAESTRWICRTRYGPFFTFPFSLTPTGHHFWPPVVILARIADVLASYFIP